MFAIVLYGNQESLLINPYCSIINLLNSIKARCGYGNSTCVIDLSDQTGLVLELGKHAYEYANKYLTTKGPYILVEKQIASLGHDTSISPSTPQVSYVPLLDCCNERFPNYQTRVAIKGSPLATPSPTRAKSKKGKKQKKSLADKRADYVFQNM